MPLWYIGTCKFEELQEKCNITEEELDLQIQEADLFELASCFDNIDDYLEKLGLSSFQQSDVQQKKFDTESTQAGMKFALKIWLKRNPFGETFRSLLSLVLPLKKVTVAVSICRWLKEKGMSESLIMW